MGDEDRDRGRDILTRFTPPSEEELQAVAALQETMTARACEHKLPREHKFSDTAVLRFYRGRESSKEKAERSMLRHIKWRNEFEVDDISSQSAQQNFEVEMNTRKGIIGDELDKENRPVMYIIAGRHDRSKRNIHAVRQYLIYLMEETIKKSAPEQERIAICFDLSDFSLACMDYEVIKALIEIITYNYPEVLALAYIVNAPFIFNVCWAVIKNWIGKATFSFTLNLKVC